jgi:4-amino-4-deoxy-L-arabinose transferase-like glycosyltransferase
MEPAGMQAQAPQDNSIHLPSVMLLVAVCAALFLSNAHVLPLGEPDEARCGLIVREMLQDGHWLLPHLRGEPYYDKPAAFFWLAAGGQLLTGSAELGGRLVAAIAALAAVLAAYSMARRVFGGAMAGLLAGLVLATMGEFLFMARWYRMDMPFAAAIWASLWWFLRRQHQPQPRGGRMLTWTVFYAICGVGTLLKGPAALVLPGLVVGLYLVLSRQYGRLLEMLHPVGLAAYVLVASPPYVLAELEQPGYLAVFFLKHNVQRFAEPLDPSHGWPGVLYVPIAMGGMMPWTIYLPGAAARYFPRRWRARADKPAMLYLWLCAIVPMAFFAVSGTKLVSYILPVFAPLSVLVGGLLTDWIRSPAPDRLMRAGGWAMTGVVAVLGCAAALGDAWFDNVDLWLVLPLVASAAGAAAMVWALRRNLRRVFIGATIGTLAAVSLFAVFHIAPAGYDYMGVRRLGALARELGLREEQVCFLSSTRLSFLFYAHIRSAANFEPDHPGELDRLAARFNEDAPFYCVVTGAHRMEQLRRVCAARVKVLAAEGNTWLVSNQGP